MSAEIPTIFVRLLRDTDKGGALATSVASLQRGEPDARVFVVRSESLRQVPGAPFAYWVGERIRRLFGELPAFEGEGRTVKQGLATADDFRFVRFWWEVPTEQILDAQRGPDWRADSAAFQAWCRQRTFEGKCWVTFAKGGEYSPYYADHDLTVNWSRDGREIRNLIDPNTGRTASRPQGIEFFFRPGVTYLSRTSLRLCATPMSAGTAFSHVGPAVFPHVGDLETALARLNSYTAEAFIAPYHARGTEGDDQT